MRGDIMAWEDPLKLGRNKKRRSIKDEFKSEVHPFVQNMILSDYLSNFALALIGDEDKIDYKITQSVAGTYDKVNFFKEIENVSEGLDTLFLSLLDICFDNETEKYRVLSRHFQLFKQVNMLPILETLMKDDRELCSLVIGAFELKLAGDLPFREALKRQNDRLSILDYLGPVIAREVDDIEEYTDDIMLAFCESAEKLNPDILSLPDYTSLKKRLFSEALLKVLSEHIEWMKLGYFSMLYGKE